MPNAVSDVLVVGGGLAGLSCAVALSDAGLKVTVLESGSALGGRARSWIHEGTGDTVDIGPHVVHSEYANFLKFLERLGTREHIHWQSDPVLTLTSNPVFRLRHLPLPPPLSLFPGLLSAPGLRLRDLLSNLPASLTALRLQDDDLGALDEVTAEDFLLERGVTPGMIDWFWRLACMTTINTPLERCSAAALLRIDAQISGYRDFHFGFPDIGLGDLYIAQSVGAISALGGRVVLGACAACCEREFDTHVIKTTDARRFAARHVVYAIPPAELGALQPELADTGAFEPSPYRSIYLWFDRRITQECFWSLMWSPDRLNYDFYDLAGIRPSRQAGPSLIASNIIYCHRVAGWSGEALIARTRDELALFAPAARRARLLHAEVHAIPMAVPCHVPGIERKRPRTRTVQPRVFLAGDWTHTRLPFSMESAVRSGYLAADAVLAAEGRASALAIAPRGYDAIAGWINRRARGQHQAPALPEKAGRAW